MKGNLAIMAPHVGAASETFIRRHIEDLLPGRTVVVARYEADRSAGYWSIQSPSLVLNRLPATFGSRLRRVSRKFGLPVAPYELAAARRFVRSHGVTAVMAEWLDLGLPWFEFARQLGLKFFVHAHGYDVSRRHLADPKWSREYLRYNHADGIISMSALGRERLIALGLQPNKVHAIPYGVDVPSTMPSRVPGKAVRCIAVGRMVAKKAPILLLDAFRRAAERCPQLRLDYVGGGALYPAASQFVRAFGLENRVCLHGSQPSDRVKELLLGADVFLQHSVTDPETGDEEGLPVAILEAMAAGLPVVSTRHAGIPEAVVDGESGFLVAEGDLVGMAERIVRLAHDNALRVGLGHAGWRRAQEKFSWERERRGLLDILGFVSPSA
jgi:colanic acid/amylovoran biosynthesis glycosyltransferase